MFSFLLRRPAPVCFSTLSVSAWDLQSQAIGGYCQQKTRTSEGNGRFAFVNNLHRVKNNVPPEFS
jgi:hypothetical protein